MHLQVSLPSWECGLKFIHLSDVDLFHNRRSLRGSVVGVWIEIQEYQYIYKRDMSLPSWECGLKYREHHRGDRRYCRSFRGSVD